MPRAKNTKRQKYTGQQLRYSYLTQKVLTFLPRMCVDPCVAHKISRKERWLVDYGPQAPINTTRHISTAQTGVSHTHGVACRCLRTAASKRCALSLLSVIYLVRTCLGCVFVKGLNADDILPVCTYKITPLVLKPGKTSYPRPPTKKTFSACHALHTARIEPGSRSMCPAGLLPCRRVDYIAFRRKVLVPRDMFEKIRKIHKHT